MRWGEQKVGSPPAIISGGYWGLLRGVLERVCHRTAAERERERETVSHIKCHYSDPIRQYK